MSTKTLRKRISLVAVTALGAGLLSVVAVPSANATGAVVNLTGSTGLLASANEAGVTGTATLLSTGTLSVTVDGAAGAAQARLTVVGGVIQTASDAAVIAANQLSVTEKAGDFAVDFAVTITPTVAAGQTMTVRTFGTATGTTVVSQIVVTVAASSVAGVVSVANSSVAFTATDGAAATTDVAGEDKTTVGTPLFLNVQLKDAYKATITSTTGALVVTVAAGARVSISPDDGVAPDNATFSQAVSSASPADLNIQVDELSVGTGWSGTITVTYNGVIIATKTGTITGAPATITLTNKKLGKTGGANAAALDYQVRDIAGNVVVLTQTDLVFSSSSNTAVVTTGVGDGINSATAAGTATFTCTALAGTADLVLQTTLANATVIKSNAVTVRCGGTAASYTASFDKAAYTQGDIATLTVSFKDASSNAANSYDAVSGNAVNQVITVNQTERVTAHAVDAKLNVSGNLVYTFTVGTSSGAIAGKYQALVSFPTVTTGTTQTVGYEISGSAGVSNADVLKSIVALIASINKQIQALQKLILKR